MAENSDMSVLSLVKSQEMSIQSKLVSAVLNRQFLSHRRPLDVDLDLKPSFGDYHLNHRAPA